MVIVSEVERLKVAVILLSVKAEGEPVVKLTAFPGMEKVMLSISETVRIVMAPFFHSKTCWLCAMAPIVTARKAIRVNIFFIAVLFYLVIVLGIRYSITYAYGGAYHKDARGVQWNAERAAIGGLFLHCHTAAGKVVDADALSPGQTEDLKQTATDADSDVGRILCAWGRVYACNGELAEADIPNISKGVNNVSAVGGGDCQFLAHSKTWFGGEGKGYLCAVLQAQDNAFLCSGAKNAV